MISNAEIVDMGGFIVRMMEGRDEASLVGGYTSGNGLRGVSAIS